MFRSPNLVYSESPAGGKIIQLFATLFGQHMEYNTRRTRPRAGVGNAWHASISIRHASKASKMKSFHLSSNKVHNLQVRVVFEEAPGSFRLFHLLTIHY